MPIVSFPIGTRRFAPSWPMTLLTIALCLAFLKLGNWQWDRGVHRQAEWDAFARGADAPLPLGTQDLGSLVRFKRIVVSGRWDAAHQFLLDNRSHGGLPGYEVLTPLQLADGRVLLVDRGWVPFTGSRAKLPPVALARTATVALTGRLDNLPVGGLALGHAAPAGDARWPKVTSFPTFAELAAALNHPVAPWMLLLDPASADGYLRDWQAPGLPPLRHFSYAVQWWGFAVTLLIIWGIMSARREEPQQPT
jgi:cytochrome oxidase assembly protein ShyY1